MAAASIVIVAAATWLWLDLLFAWIAKRPVSGRNVLAAVALNVLVVARICQRILDGTL